MENKFKNKGIAFFKKHIKVQDAYLEYINDENGENCFLTLPHYEGIALGKLMDMRGVVSCGKVSFPITKEELATFNNHGIETRYVNAYNLVKNSSFEFNLQQEEIVIFKASIKGIGQVSSINGISMKHLETYLFNKDIENKFNFSTMNLEITKSCIETFTKEFPLVEVESSGELIHSIMFGGVNYYLTEENFDIIAAL